jgi:hypothetical protein
LHRLAFDHLEGGAQDFVASEQFVGGAVHGRDIERTSQAAGGEDIVSRVAGLQLVYEPQSFLIDGRRVEVRCHTLDARNRLCFGSVESLLLEPRFKQSTLLRT